MADIKPLGCQVALKIFDDGDGDDDTAEMTSGSPNVPSDDSYNEAIYALVLGVGSDVQAKVKKGDTVLVRKSACNGVRVDDDVVLASEYCLLATVSA